MEFLRPDAHYAVLRDGTEERIVVQFKRMGMTEGNRPVALFKVVEPNSIVVNAGEGITEPVDSLAAVSALPFQRLDDIQVWPAGVRLHRLNHGSTLTTPIAIDSSSDLGLASIGDVA